MSVISLVKPIYSIAKSEIQRGILAETPNFNHSENFSRVWTEVQEHPSKWLKYGQKCII